MQFNVNKNQYRKSSVNTFSANTDLNPCIIKLFGRAPVLVQGKSFILQTPISSFPYNNFPLVGQNIFFINKYQLSFNCQA